MRNALLAAIVPVSVVASVLVIGLASTSLVACGDASSSTNQRGHGYVPGPNDDPSDDPNAPVDPPSAPNPNTDAPPPAPTTAGTSAAEFDVALSSATPSADLGTSVDVTVTITPKAGATGDATLAVTGLPADATSVFMPATVTLGAAPVTSRLTISVPYTAAPSAPGAASAIVVKATAGTSEATANANFKINPKITMTIPVNAAALIAAAGGAKNVDGWAGPVFGSAPQPLQTQAGNGITFVVKNADSTAHEVHGQNGFPHGDAPVAPGDTDPKTRVLNAGVTNAGGYVHGAPNNAGVAVGFVISVKTAP